MKRTRVLLADDHPKVTEALKRILSAEFDVISTVEDGLALVSATVELVPDVVVADVSMPKLDGFSALQQLKSKCPEVKVILISMFLEPALVTVALQWGASGFVSKITANEDLNPAVRAAIDGKTFCSSSLALR